MLQATDYLRGDVAVKGGITTLVKTAHLAEAFRMNYEIHHGGNSLNNVAQPARHHGDPQQRDISRCCCPTARRNTGWSQDIVVGQTGWCMRRPRPASAPRSISTLIEQLKIGVLS